MAINGLQIPGYQMGPDANFAPLAQLPQLFQQGQARATLQNLPRKADGSIDTAPLYNSGDMNLAKLGADLDRQQQAQVQNAQELALRQQTLANTQQYQNKSLAIQERNAANNEDYTPEELKAQLIANGVDPRSPQGQAFILNRGKTFEPAAGQPKPRQMSYGDISKLTEEGGKLQQVNRFVDSFEDDFGGRGGLLGDARNWVGRNLPDAVVDPKAQKGATYWQDYQKYRSVVRNELYGSALTAPERRDFEAADITPGMNPKQIRANLKIQQDILQGAATRKSAALESEGYNPETIRKAYGVTEKPAATGKSGTTKSGTTWTIE